MPAALTTLRDEHRALLPQILALRTTADRIGAMSRAELGEAVGSRVSFLRDHLTPHARAEDEVMYPIVADLIGGAEATATMRRDHVEVMRLADRLQSLRERLSDGVFDDETANDLRRVLYGLFAIVSLHFAKEEEIYLPLLERGMTQPEAEQMFAAMGHAHHQGAVALSEHRR